ncbi:MAG: hypothetical protein F4164_01055, partial [Gemmatimonadales bacterium]|nr:hypothetical protein [Gemmatimonadales bacterium]
LTGGRTSVSAPSSYVVAHELGHNMSLQHAPCGNPSGVDPSFPYANGSSGAWGYDFTAGTLVSPNRPDLMSYCRPEWISDYHFTNALRDRLFDEGAPAPDAPTASLLLWGGMDGAGDLFLEPAFVVEAPPALPDSAGAFALAGRDGDGRELFSLSFDMVDGADGDGSSGFAFALPARPEWADDLSRIVLSGPSGEARLTSATARPMAILRDPRSGRIRGLLRNLPASVATLADAREEVAPERGLEILFSRGIPDGESWRR